MQEYATYHYHGVKYHNVVQPVLNLACPQKVDLTHPENFLFFELLMRQHPKDHSVANAQELIDRFEASGEIRKFDISQVKHAMPILKVNPRIRVSVNVSMATLGNDHAIDLVIQQLESEQVHVCRRLVIEIIEKHKGDDKQTVLRNISRLHKLGCKIAMDDVPLWDDHRDFIHHSIWAYKCASVPELPAVKNYAAAGKTVIVEHVWNDPRLLLFLRRMNIKGAQGWELAAPIPVLRGGRLGIPTAFLPRKGGPRIPTLLPPTPSPP